MKQYTTANMAKFQCRWSSCKYRNIDGSGSYMQEENMDTSIGISVLRNKGIRYTY